MTACHHLANETFLTTSVLKKNAAIRDQFRHAGNENPLIWMVSDKMGRQKIFQNSENQSKAVELGLSNVNFLFNNLIYYLVMTTSDNVSYVRSSVF